METTPPASNTSLFAALIRAKTFLDTPSEPCSHSVGTHNTGTIGKPCSQENMVTGHPKGSSGSMDCPGESLFIYDRSSDTPKNIGVDFHDPRLIAPNSYFSKWKSSGIL